MAINIFPSNGSSDERSRHLRKLIQNFHDSDMSQNLLFQQEANTDSLLEAGDQAALNSLGFNRVLPYMDMYTSNKMKRMVSLVSGLQRRERKSTVVVPLEDADQETADQFTKLLFNINNNYNVLDTISDGFQSALITGLSLLQIWVDYREDPISGSIKVDVCPYNSFVIDSTFTKADLSDCSAIWKRSYLTEGEVKSLLPEHKKRIEDLSSASAGNDDLFPYLSSSYHADTNFLSYDEFYYRDYRMQKLLIDTATGEVQEYRGQNDEILPLFLKKHPTVKLENKEVPTVRLAILVNGEVLYDGLNPLGFDSYPFVAITALMHPQIPDMYLKFQGLVRGMRDNQFLFNLMTSLEVEYVQTRVNPGIVYKPSSLIDPKVVERRDLSGNIAVDRVASIDDVKFVNPMDVPQTVPMIREQSGKELVESVGNEDMLGTGTNDNLAGVLSMLRTNNGMVILQPVMDALDRAQKILGDLQILTIQYNYTPGKVARILNEEPSQQFYNKTFSKYDSAVEEGVNTTTQRQNQFTQLMALKVQAQIDIPDEILLKASTIQNKQEVLDFMEDAAKRQAEAQEQEVQVNQQLQQAEIALATSKAELDKARAAQNYAKIQDDRTQALSNLAEANKDDEQATLNKIKALKELESIDFANLETLINAVNAVKATEQVAKQQLVAKTPVSPTPVSPKGMKGQ